ncbi:hypothetical protein ACFS7Z_07000 [Pontibacter toksunensis]|uniref:Uncharacterized protein n=1 Tax=Pontibacter toksunensis TaxID=1332631 RepID=A0ABW6BS58_9BACT
MLHPVLLYLNQFQDNLFHNLSQANNVDVKSTSLSDLEDLESEGFIYIINKPTVFIEFTDSPVDEQVEVQLTDEGRNYIRTRMNQLELSSAIRGHQVLVLEFTDSELRRKEQFEPYIHGMENNRQFIWGRLRQQGVEYQIWLDTISNFNSSAAQFRIDGEIYYNRPNTVTVISKAKGIVVKDAL